MSFKYKKNFYSEDGKNGQDGQKSGKKGEDLIINDLEKYLKK